MMMNGTGILKKKGLTKVAEDFLLQHQLCTILWWDSENCITIVIYKFILINFKNTTDFIIFLQLLMYYIGIDVNGYSM